MNTITWNDFEKISMLVGTIVSVEDFPQARKPAYKLRIDLGVLGIKTSSAQITKLYTKEQLVGKQVICVTNFPPRKIGPFSSEVLTCGFNNEEGDVVLAVPERALMNGARLF